MFFSFENRCKITIFFLHGNAISENFPHLKFFKHYYPCFEYKMLLFKGLNCYLSTQRAIEIFLHLF